MNESSLNTFCKTVIYKNDSSLSKQIKELKSIRNENNKYKIDKDEVDNEINSMKLGMIGEKELIHELETANLGLYVLRDIRIKIEDMVAQIDFVVISKKYTYLIECKNWSSDVKVDELGQFLVSYKNYSSIYSPYRQATMHKDILLKYCESKFDRYSGVAREENIISFNKFFKPLVVFTNSKAKLDISKAPKDERNNIIRLDQLVNYIKKDLNTTDSMPLLTKKDMKLYAKQWKEMGISEYYSAATKYKNERNLLQDRLKKFREIKSKKMNLTKDYEDYIFSDKELKKILDEHPRNKEELKKILSPVKLKCHGNEILDILNK